MMSDAVVKSGPMVMEEVVLEGATVSSMTSRRIQNAIIVKIPMGLLCDESEQRLAFVQQLVARIVSETTSLTDIRQEITIAGHGAVITGNLHHESIGQQLYLEITPSEDLSAELVKLHQAQKVLFNNITELIAQIRDHDTQLKQHSAISLSSLDIANYCEQSFIPALESSYSHFQSIDRLFEGRAIPIDDSFINVTVVAAKEKRNKEEALRKKNDEDEEEGSLEEEKPEIGLQEQYRSWEGDLGLYEKIYLPNREIALGEIFSSNKKSTSSNEENQSIAKHVLVEGHAGIGKSTLLKFFAYQWSQRSHPSDNKIIQAVRDQLKSHFSGVIWIALRELNKFTATQSVDIADLLVNQPDFSLTGSSSYLSSDQKDQNKKRVIQALNFYKNQEKKPLLYMLDGWDELDSVIFKESSERGQVLRTFLEQPAWLITSRPGRVPAVVLEKKETHLELLGFNYKSIISYVRQFFDNDMTLDFYPPDLLSSRLITFIDNPRIAGIAHIPVNLELLCYVWKDKADSFSGDISLSQLYYEIVAWLLKRFHDREKCLNVGAREVSTLIDPEQTWPLYQLGIQCLQVLAFEGMKNKSLLLDFKDSKYRTIFFRYQPKTVEGIRLYNQSITNCEALKKLQGTNSDLNDTDPLKQTYYFVHLSFQEFFVACYLINWLCASEKEERNKAVIWIAENKYFLRYRDVMGLLVNLLYIGAGNEILLKNVLGLQETKWSLIEDRLINAQALFWSAVLGVQIDLVGLRQMELLIFLANHMGEAVEKMPVYEKLYELVREIINYKEKAIKFSIKIEFQPERTWFNRLCEALRYCSVSLRERLLSELISKLQHKNKDIKQEAFKIVRRLGSVAAIPRVINEIAKELDDCALWDNQKTVIDMVLEFDHVVRTPLILNKIIILLCNALSNTDSYIQQYALLRLGKLGHKAAIPVVLDSIVCLLSNENKYIRESAFQALKAFGPTAAREDILAELYTALLSKTRRVRVAAYEAIEPLGLTDTMIVSRISTALLEALRSNKEKVRRGGFGAVGLLGISAIMNDEIRAKLLDALCSDEEDLREHAHGIVIILSPTILVVPEIRAKLLEALLSDKESLQKCALSTLAHLGPMEEARKFSDVLLTFLKKEDNYIQSLAIDAVEKMGPEVVTQQIQDELIKKLCHVDYAIRKHARNALISLHFETASLAVHQWALKGLDSIDADIQREALQVINQLNFDMTSDIAIVIKQETLTEPMLLKLVALLNSQDIWAQRSALKTIRIIGPGAVTAEIYNGLYNALCSNDTSVKRQAVITVCSLGPSVIKSEIIVKVINFLHEDGETQAEIDYEPEITYSRAKQAAYEILTILDPEKIAPEILAKILRLLRSEEWSVRNKKLELLKNLGPRISAIPEIHHELFIMLNSKDKYIQKKTLKILRSFGGEYTQCLLQECVSNLDVIRMFMLFAAESICLLVRANDQQVQLIDIRSEQKEEFSLCGFVSAYNAIIKDESFLRNTCLPKQMLSLVAVASFESNQRINPSFPVAPLAAQLESDVNQLGKSYLVLNRNTLFAAVGVAVASAVAWSFMNKK